MDEEKTYYVYKHTNLINNKVYIGITSAKTPQNRWLSTGSGYKKNEHFWRAIQKYGWSNFSHEILFENLIHDEACKKEIELVAYYDSTNPDNGYNLTKGGDAHVEFSEETLQKMSASQKKRFENKEDHPMYGRKHSEKSLKQMGEKHKKENLSEETLQKMSISQKIKCADPEYRRKMSECGKKRCANPDIKQKLKEQAMKRPVLQFDLDGNFIAEYESAAEAGRQTGSRTSGIGHCCNHELMSSNNFIWYFKDDPNLCIDNISYNNGIFKPICQFTLNGVLVAKYKSLVNAMEETGIDIRQISGCCTGIQKSAHGFIWRFDNDDLDIENIKYEVKRFTPVVQFTKDGEFVAEFNSIKEASEATGAHKTTISGCCKGQYKTAGGFKWRYKDDYDAEI